MINIFRKVAVLEGISLLLILLVTMPLKYMMDIPEPTIWIGWAHGVLFVVYSFMLLPLLVNKTITFLEAVVLFIASFIPFGTFIADNKILKPKSNQ